MARPRRTGLDYFPLDVDMFSNKNIRVLKARFGADGVTVYMFLLCEMYRNGYFVEWDEDYTYVIGGELGLSAETVAKVVELMVSRGLLVRVETDIGEVLTSEGVQKRYQEAIRERVRKTKAPMTVREPLWLLDEESTANTVEVICLDGTRRNGKPAPESEEDTDIDIPYCDTDCDDHSEDIPRKNPLKESKEKESKEKESKEKESREKESRENESREKESTEKESTGKERREKERKAQRGCGCAAFPPSLNDVKLYCGDMRYTFSPERFYNWYEAKGWKQNGDAIENWKALADNWQAKESSSYTGGRSEGRDSAYSVRESNSTFDVRELEELGWFRE